MNELIAGIDLGTTNSEIAAIISERVQLFPRSWLPE